MARGVVADCLSGDLSFFVRTGRDNQSIKDDVLRRRIFVKLEGCEIPEYTLFGVVVSRKANRDMDDVEGQGSGVGMPRGETG